MACLRILAHNQISMYSNWTPVSLRKIERISQKSRPTDIPVAKARSSSRECRPEHDISCPMKIHQGNLNCSHKTTCQCVCGCRITDESSVMMDALCFVLWIVHVNNTSRLHLIVCNLFLFVKRMTSEDRISSWLLIVLRDITGMSLQMEWKDLRCGERHTHDSNYLLNIIIITISYERHVFMGLLT